MRLTELLADYPSDFQPPPDPEISSVVSDSRRAGSGSLFVAIRGEKANGLDFARNAIDRGAAAVAAESAGPEPLSVPWVRVSNARLAAAVLSSRALGDPARHLRLAGITGTNGKTTTAVLLSDVFREAWGASGFLGTTGYRWGGRSFEAPRTTPEGDVLAEALAQMVAERVPACAMEVSSHALSLERVAGLRFDAAVFTNLTRDHLDFHGTLENYGAAKARLFGLRKEGGAGIVNVDDPFGAGLFERIAGPRFSFSPSGNPAADFRAEGISVGLEGTSFRVEGTDLAPAPGESGEKIESPLVGRFNVENLLGAWAASRALGIEPGTIRAALAKSGGAPGRMERVDAGQPFTILVDYAHTEDALRRLLSGVRELTDRTIILVFGCGGDRDRGKREPMGRAAAELSDIPIATSDNPRGEDPAEILREVEAGLRNGGASKYLKFVDRREAIGKAIELANSRSIVVIAGKGHETVQVIGSRSEPFDDRAVAAEFAARLRKSGVS